MNSKPNTTVSQYLPMKWFASESMVNKRHQFERREKYTANCGERNVRFREVLLFSSIPNFDPFVEYPDNRYSVY